MGGVIYIVLPNFVTQSSSFENYFRFMPRYIHIILLTISASFGHFGAAGATNTDEITVRFRVNSSAVDTTYCSNADALSLLLNKIDSINGNGSIKLEQIVLAGSASPEGPTEYNRRLSDQRLKALREHILLKTGIADSLIRETHRLTDWGLLAEMVEGSDMPQKEEALSLIRKMPEYITEADGREIIELRSKLTGLSDGKAWRYMMLHYFPTLRNACAVMITSAEEPATVNEDKECAVAATVSASETELKLDTVAESTVSQPAELPAANGEMRHPRKPFYMSVYTNMLYDALLTPNIGAEIYLGHNRSIAADWKHGWWKSDRRHRYWRIYGGAITLRQWFGSAAAGKPLTGHHLGIYGEMFTYDFEFGDRGQMGGEPRGTIFDRANYAAGIEYGYSLPVSKHLNIDFSLGIGYLGGKYYEYKPSDGHYVWQTSKQRHWFGPTRASVSLVWLIGCGNINRKGGREL